MVTKNTCIYKIRKEKLEKEDNSVTHGMKVFYLLLYLMAVRTVTLSLLD